MPNPPSAPSVIDHIVKEPLTGHTAFVSPKVARLAAWWRERAASGVPLRSSFDILDHGALAADLYLIEAAGDDFVVKIHGEAVKRIFGAGKTGRGVLTHQRSRSTHQHYAMIVNTGRAYRCRGTLNHHNKDYIAFESVDCPLSSDGRKIDFIIGVIETVPREAIGF